MFYIVSKPTLEAKWKPVLNQQDGTRLTFVSEREADEAATELAMESTDLFVAVNEEGNYISLIYSTHNPYSFSDDQEATPQIN